MPTVTIAGKTHEVQRFDLVKALRIITLLNIIQKLVPDVAEELAKFAANYREQHVEQLDRVQAKLRFGGDIPVYDSNDRPMLNNAGDVVTVPAPIERMSEEDWARSGHHLTRPEDPSTAALIAAVFPMIAERAEEPLMLLLAICITPNDDFRRDVKNGVWQEKAKAFAEEAIAPAYLEEVIELAVTVGEVIEGQVLSKITQVGERVGKLRHRFLPRSVPTPEPSTITAEPSSTSGSSSSPSDTSTPPTSPPESDGTPSSPSESTGESSETKPSSSRAASAA